MKFVKLIVGVVLFLTPLAAENGTELYQKAVVLERAAGNLPEAIKLYQRVAKEYASDHALAAKALIQAARCYEKLGEDGALKLYERVARDYADQTEYAQAARAKVAALREPPPPPTVTLRKIELADSLKSMKNFVTTDGVHALYWDDTNTALWSSDIAGNNKHTVLQLKPDETRPLMDVSRDLSIVLLEYPGRRWAVVKTDGTGYRELPEMDKLPSEGAVYSPSFSWDNRIALVPKGGRLWKVSLADGHVTEIPIRERKSVIESTDVSPDGRHIAINSNLTVSVVPMQGGEAQEVSKAAVSVDWTRDGRYLILGVLAGTKMDYLLQPMQDGRPSGNVVHLSSSHPQLLTRARVVASGAILMMTGVGSMRQVRSASIASLDARNQLGPWKQLDLVGNADSVTWSGDGKQIAYVSKEGPTDVLPVIRIHNLDSGQDRELYRLKDSLNVTCSGALQAAVLFCGSLGVNTPQSTDILRVSSETGRAEKIATLDGQPRLLSISRDDRFINLATADGQVLSRWEIGAAKAVRLPEGRLSQSGGWLTRDVTGGFQIRPASEDSTSWGSTEGAASPAFFTPDDQWVLFLKREPENKFGVYRRALASSEVQRLGDYPSNFPRSVSIRVSPDGRQIAVSHPTEVVEAREYLLFENFVPRTVAPAKATPVKPTAPAKTGAKQ